MSGLVRIAQVAPLFESVPPRLYGGTERVISYLTEELVKLGHEVTLYASGDSVTGARLVAPCPRALRLEKSCRDHLPHHLFSLELLARDAGSYDIVHFHLDYLHFSLATRLRVPSLTTQHGRLDLLDPMPLFREFKKLPMISISDAQRGPLPWANWQRTVHHGLPTELHRFHPEPGKYLAFLGRVSPEKRVDRAIEIAARVGMPLKIAAKVDVADATYFTSQIEPLLKRPGVEFVGEVGGAAKEAFLGNAYALLFPIDWPEPFGLVMIEAMACGTPVIAYRRGSVPEIVEDGVTGFIVEDIEGAAAALARVPQFDRRRCRAEFEARFMALRMTRDYLDAYERVRRESRG